MTRVVEWRDHLPDAVREYGREAPMPDAFEPMLATLTDTIERSESPFADAVQEPGVHWVMPERVAEVRFTEWTGDGKLRHPRFIGERDDKNPRDIVREKSNS